MPLLRHLRYYQPIFKGLQISWQRIRRRIEANSRTRSVHPSKRVAEFPLSEPGGQKGFNQKPYQFHGLGKGCEWKRYIQLSWVEDFFCLQPVLEERDSEYQCLSNVKTIENNQSQCSEGRALQSLEVKLCVQSHVATKTAVEPGLNSQFTALEASKELCPVMIYVVCVPLVICPHPVFTPALEFIYNYSLAILLK